MSPPEVGVLLPVRLETRFHRVGRPARWQLRVRVIPDAVSIANHDELASQAELDAVGAMWRAAGGTGLETVAGRRAWRELARAVGPERAAWLARTFPPTTDANGQITVARPSETRSDMRAPKVSGLPPTMELWIARGGQQAVHAATLAVRADDIDLELDDPDSTAQPWWVSFDEAKRVGLAAELDLGTAQPNDIDALYVVGIGGGDPGPLINAQVDSGRLGLVPPGSATNSVDGEPAVSLGDTNTWRRLVAVDGRAQPGGAAVANAFGVATRGVVGGEHDHRPLNSALVGALWPALWGHSLGNVWGDAGHADELGLWAAANLVPEGPLPSLRIDNLPYGLLPATSLRRWKPGRNDPPIEARLVPLVRTLVDRWAATAERHATERNHDALSTLVRTPSAVRFAWRWMMPTTLAHALSFRFNEAVGATELDGWWTRQTAATPRLDPAAGPLRRLVSVGWSHEVELPMVEADDLDQRNSIGSGLARLAAASVAELLAAGPVDGQPRATPPWGTSMLTELARHSLLATAAAAARSASGRPTSIVEPVSVNQRVATEAETWAARLRPVDLSRSGDAAVGLRRNVVAGLNALATARVDDLDRGLKATLETATSRIDPWATAIAWRRLQDLAAAPRTLGVYGWIDAPRPRAAPPDDRFVVAPSTEQAAVTAVLRDRALHDADADRWQMKLTSDPIRGALRLAELTGQGNHPAESLGQMVEAIVQRPLVVDRLREHYPTVHRLARPGLKTRRVCDGALVLEAAVNRPDELRQLGVLVRQITALVELAASIDALADLHVAEAVLGVVKGRSASVAAVTSAAAGQAPSPSFDVVRTPRGGRVVNTVAVMILADADAPSGPSPSPAAVADAAVAAFLDKRSGDPTSAAWRWNTLDATGAPTGTVTLAETGLRPCDTAALGTAQLREIVRDASGAAALGPTDPPGHATVRLLATALAGVPALADDVGDQPDTGTAGAELATRYAAVRQAAIAAVALAQPATAANATSEAKRHALVELARWGITPLAADTDDPTIAGIDDRLVRAIEALQRRVDESPASLDGATMPVLASSIGALVSPEAAWPVFARLPAAAFSGVRREPTTGSTPRLDPDWLEIVAPVRPALARFEAIQLHQRLTAGGRAFPCWSNRPGDPWQTVPPEPSDTEVVRPSRLVAVFGPNEVLPARPVAATSGTVAVAVIDRFAETVPATEQVSSVAFAHDLPPARAPQAIVLAVPPVVDQELTAAVLVDIVADLRKLTRARMADAADVGPAGSSLHLAALPASGRTGVGLGAR